jgi:hypothetical protein
MPILFEKKTLIDYDHFVRMKLFDRFSSKKNFLSDFLFRKIDFFRVSFFTTVKVREFTSRFAGPILQIRSGKRR